MPLTKLNNLCAKLMQKLMEKKKKARQQKVWDPSVWETASQRGKALSFNNRDGMRVLGGHFPSSSPSYGSHC